MIMIGERDLLVRLYEATEESKLGYKEAVNAIAEKHGLAPSSIRKFVAALVRDQAEAVKQEAQEVLDLFEAEAEGTFGKGDAEVKASVTLIPANRQRQEFTSMKNGQKVSGWTQ